MIVGQIECQMNVKNIHYHIRVVTCWCKLRKFELVKWMLA